MPMPMPITPAQADRFATAWYAAWNSGSVRRIVAQYAADAELLSPLIGTVLGREDERLRGRAAIEQYVAGTLTRFPGLRLDPRLLLVGTEGVSLQYDMVGGLMVMEALELDADLLVTRSSVHLAVELRTDIERAEVPGAPLATLTAPRTAPCLRVTDVPMRRPGWRR
jgi:SnoaL-like domain